MIKEYRKPSDYFLMTKCPYERRMPNGFIVGCGKCYYCRKKIARELAFRCEQESFDMFTYNVLISYDDEHLPIRNGHVTLNKVHFQDFMKRLRDWFFRYYKVRLRYLVVGEYGGKKGRPHMHMILWCPMSLENPKKDFDERGLPCPLAFISSIITEKWQKGACDVEPIGNTGSSVVYMVQYMLTDYKQQSHLVEKPFRLMSRGRGIGYRWLERNKELCIYMINNNNHVQRKQLKDGSTISVPIPRYYKRKYIPECQQIATADEYYYCCEEFITKKNNYLENYGKRDYTLYIDRAREHITRIGEQSYRERKVKEHGRQAGRLFARSAKRRKGTAI